MIDAVTRWARFSSKKIQLLYLSAAARHFGETVTSHQAVDANEELLTNRSCELE
jgi:hypothetical protein